MNKRSMMGVLSCLALAAIGCGGQPATSSEDATVRVTAVHLDPDPTKTVVTYETMTAAELRALVDARTGVTAAQPAAAPTGGERIGSAQAAISQDTGCASTSMMLFDSTDSSDRDVGEICGFECFQNDIICFSGTGTASLYDYTWETNYSGSIVWAGRVRAYSPGCSGGEFVEGDQVELFSASQGFTTAGTVAQGASSLSLGKCE